MRPTRLNQPLQLYLAHSRAQTGLRRAAFAAVRLCLQLLLLLQRIQAVSALRRVCAGIAGSPAAQSSVMQLLPANSCPSSAESVLDELSIHLVAFDRPGYGQSSPQRGRNFTTFVHDLEQLADHLRCPPGYSVEVSAFP